MKRLIGMMAAVVFVAVVYARPASAQSHQCLICEDGPTPNCGYASFAHYDDGSEGVLFGYWNFGGITGPFCDFNGPWCYYAHAFGCYLGGEEAFTKEDLDAVVGAVPEGDVGTVARYLAGGRVRYDAGRGRLNILSCDGKHLVASIRLSGALSLAVYSLYGAKVSETHIAGTGGFGLPNNGSAFRSSLQ